VRQLYLDIDMLRADHLGCAGYHRATTPNIDTLAADGVRVSNVYASDVPCLPSRTALATGASASDVLAARHHAEL
jgi:arylsulfatase A-like enzyme